MDDCIFCKLANGSIPTNSIYEDEDFKVILDAAPANFGHALILPKKHARDLLELDEETAKSAFSLAKRVATKMKAELGCDGINIVQNNGEAAGQTVFHFHVHIIPRYENDGAGIGWKQKKYGDGEAEKMAERLRGRV